MEFSVTKLIEGTIRDLLKSKTGDSIANTYSKNAKFINFGIIFALALVLNSVMSGMFSAILGGWFGTALGFFVAWLWTWSMTVGPLSKIWGYGASANSKKSTKVTEYRIE